MMTYLAVFFGGVTFGIMVCISIDKVFRVGEMRRIQEEHDRAEAEQKYREDKEQFEYYLRRMIRDTQNSEAGHE